MQFTRRGALGLFLPAAPAIIGLAKPSRAQMLTTGAGKKPGGGGTSRTTLFTWNQFNSGGGFTDTGGSITGDRNQTDSGGGSTASMFTADGLNSQHKMARTMSITASAVTVLSVDAARGSITRFNLREDQQTGDGAIFDLSLGTVIANLVSGVGSISPLGTWGYHCEVQFTYIASTFAGFRVGLLPATAVDLSFDTWTSSDTIIVANAQVQTIP